MVPVFAIALILMALAVPSVADEGPHHEAAVVGGVEIDVDISGELANFVANHRRPARK